MRTTMTLSGPALDLLAAYRFTVDTHPSYRRDGTAYLVLRNSDGDRVGGVDGTTSPCALECLLQGLTNATAAGVRMGRAQVKRELLEATSNMRSPRSDNFSFA